MNDAHRGSCSVRSPPECLLIQIIRLNLIPSNGRSRKFRLSVFELGVHLLKLRRGWELLDMLCLQPRTCGDVGVIGSALLKFY